VSATPPSADPAVVTPPVPPVRPGDLILIRAIAWWSSGQLQRVAAGIALSALPIVYDLFSKNTLTWKSGLNAIVAGIFGYIGISRAKAPDLITNTKTFDKAPVAVIPPHLAADIAAANVPKVP
jgi:hypothetical protein